MLKLVSPCLFSRMYEPAAFRRLCVETVSAYLVVSPPLPAAFRRLCVETFVSDLIEHLQKPAAFRRLCVETTTKTGAEGREEPAAFRRLCVETLIIWSFTTTGQGQPPSGGCVLKH